LTPRLAISIGCPSGIGPEVSVVAAADFAKRASSRARLLLVGDARVIVRAAEERGVAIKRLVVVQDASEAWSIARGSIAVWQPTETLSARDARHGAPSLRGGAAQLAWVDAACDLARRHHADALVTGPVSKDAIAASGAPLAKDFRGHTEHLQRRLRAREVVMAFWSETLTTALVTTHLPLALVPRAITQRAVERATYWLGAFLVDLGKKRAAPRVVVCGLNPHAGEGGLLGREETTRITPGIVRARTRLAKAKLGVRLEGPVPAETAFRLAVGGRYDGVVAMYHDQATIPMKLVGFGEAVNVSLGLPIVRTSVDHGTAYDIAGAGKASARGMHEALDLAVRLARVADFK
jgi:4-hydroxythreonine-4-phosphate dehydrogenase